MIEIDFDVWKNYTAEKNKDLIFTGFGFYYHDVDTAEYISKYFKGYMKAPTGVIGHIQIAAESVVCYTIDDFDTWLSDLAETFDFYLYDLYYIPAIPVYNVVDETTFELKTLNKPEIRGGVWKIRYAKVEKALVVTE